MSASTIDTIWIIWITQDPSIELFIRRVEVFSARSESPISLQGFGSGTRCLRNNCAVEQNPTMRSKHAHQETPR